MVWTKVMVLCNHLMEVVEAGKSQCCNGRGLICLICPWFNSIPTLGAKSVMVGNSPVPGTLGSYQTLDWARLAHAGVNRTERNHIYHLIHNIIIENFTSLQHMVCSMVMVHDITSAVHPVGHFMALQNRITCKLHQLHQLQLSTTSTVSTAPLGMKKK